MSILSSAPGSPNGNHVASGSILAIGAPVHAAVPGVDPHDISTEILLEAIENLFQDEDVVWSTDKSSALATGKANFLRITSNGDILLDVIKP